MQTIGEGCSKHDIDAGVAVDERAGVVEGAHETRGNRQNAAKELESKYYSR